MDMAGIRQHLAPSRGALLVAVAAFQVALTLGAPWGGARRADVVDGVLATGPRLLAASSTRLIASRPMSR